MQIRDHVKALNGLLSGERILNEVNLDKEVSSFIEGNRDKIKLDLDSFGSLVIHHINTLFLDDYLSPIKNHISRSIVTKVDSKYEKSSGYLKNMLSYIVDCTIPLKSSFISGKILLSIRFDMDVFSDSESFVYSINLKYGDYESGLSTDKLSGKSIVGLDAISFTQFLETLSVRKQFLTLLTKIK